MKALSSILLFLMICCLLVANAPVVSNVSALQRTDGSKIIDIYYDLYDAENSPCTITLGISANGGTDFDLVPHSAFLTGDVGLFISPGTARHIIWNSGLDTIPLDGNYVYRVFADDRSDPPIPENFVQVEGGSFNNGVSEVTLSGFFIDKYETTQAEYLAVMGVNPSFFANNPNRPVERVSWYKAIEYCNRRSIQEGLLTCYSYGSSGTNPDNWPTGWNLDGADHRNVQCNWAANGYRLPTEMEWMFAAKGGNSSQSFSYSGSNSVDEVARYQANSGNRTWDVGGLASNELETFDMSGNVWEWVWDIYEDSYPAGPQTNPSGASDGSLRVWRGGSWLHGANFCAVDMRNANSPHSSYNTIGFRVLRAMPVGLPPAEMVLIPVGGVTLGCTYAGGFIDEYPNIGVALSAFRIGKYELTQAEYESIVGSNPSSGNIGDSNPVTNVSWHEAIRYCNLRSMAEGLTPVYSIFGSTDPADWGSPPTPLDEEYDPAWNDVICHWNTNGYRLPTEAEWECAAKEVRPNPTEIFDFYIYSGSDNIDDVALYGDNNLPNSGTKEVGTKLPNARAIHDLSGNVWEWCWNWYDFYSSVSYNHTGPLSGYQRSRRGGAFHSLAWDCRVTRRQHLYPELRDGDIGFRLAQSVVISLDPVQINPPQGTYSGPLQVTLSCSHSSAGIIYTTDNSEPSFDTMYSTSIPYDPDTPITIDATTTIKAKAFLLVYGNWMESATATAEYIIEP